MKRYLEKSWCTEAKTREPTDREGRAPCRSQWASYPKDTEVFFKRGPATSRLCSESAVISNVIVCSLESSMHWIYLTQGNLSWKNSTEKLELWFPLQSSPTVSRANAVQVLCLLASARKKEQFIVKVWSVYCVWALTRQKRRTAGRLQR